MSKGWKLVCGCSMIKPTGRALQKLHAAIVDFGDLGRCGKVSAVRIVEEEATIISLFSIPFQCHRYCIRNENLGFIALSVALVLAGNFWHTLLKEAISNNGDFGRAHIFPMSRFLLPVRCTLSVTKHVLQNIPAL